MKRTLTPWLLAILLIGIGAWSWRAFVSSFAISTAHVTPEKNPDPANDASADPPSAAPSTGGSAQNPRSLASHPNGALTEIPDGALRRGLIALPDDVRARTLRRLAAMRVPFNDWEHLRIDLAGNFYYVCAAPGHDHAALSGPETPRVEPTLSIEVAASPVPVSQPPIRHSRPGAARVAYLDFNGHTTTGTAWNSVYGVTTFASRPYDTDGVINSFSDAEQAAILRIWARVAEDFAPFDIDVTTEEPAQFTPTTARILITLKLDANGQYNPDGSRAGGVAFLDVFGANNYHTTYSPAFVYADNLSNDANVAEAASHELGHNLALFHDGTTSLAYYGGHGTGETSWGPIMGTGYGRNISQWSKGEYFNANNTQDDLAILAARLTTLPDDGPDTRVGARTLTVADTVISGSGVLERTGDADRFSFTTAGGSVSISVNPFRAATGTLGGNLDARAELYASDDTLVASASPVSTPVATISTNLAPGEYTLRVLGVGVGDPTSGAPSGYTAYGSLGAYTISGTVPPSTQPLAPTITSAPEAITAIVGTTAVFSVTATGSAPIYYQWKKGTAALDGQTTRTLTLSNVQSGNTGVYSVVVSNSVGQVTSAEVALTVVSAPVAPAITSQPASQAVVSGSAANFSVTASGTAPLTYQWRRNGVAIPSANASSFSLPAATSADAGNYSVVVANSAGSVTSAAAVLTIYALPEFTQHPLPRTVIPGASAVFQAAAVSQPSPTLRWQRSTDNGVTWTNLSDGTGIAGSATDTLTLSALTISSSGNRIRCVATNSVGATPSDTALLTVAQLAPITSVANSSFHTLYLKADGSVWATGEGSWGQFGNSLQNALTTPVQIATDATAIAVGEFHSLILKTDGTLWAAGQNNFGQLGDGSTTARGEFVQIATNVATIAAHEDNSAFIKRDGSLWVFGRNYDGQLGDGTRNPRLLPYALATSVRSVALGYMHLFFLDTNGVMRGVGGNARGQLGDGTTTDRLTPVQIATNVRQMTAGYNSSAYVRNDGSVWTMGANNIGQLGDGTTTDRSTPVQIATNRTSVHAGSNHLLIFDQPAGQLYAAGNNQYGQLGDGTKNYSSTPLPTVNGIATVHAGNGVSFWVKPNGSAYAIGRNNYGQLGDGSTLDRASAVEIFASVPAVAGTPTGLAATDGTSTAFVRLTWNHLPGGLRYEVWRHTANNSSAATRVAENELVNFFEDRAANSGVTYYYWVRAVAPGGAGAFSATDTGFRVSAGTPPSFTTNPASATAFVGGNASFTVAAAGDPTPTLQWEVSTNSGGSWSILANNSNYQGVTTATLQVSNITVAFSGYRYRALATNTAGQTASSFATLTVNPATQAPTITTQPVTAFANENTPACFTVVATGPGPLSYQWRRNGADISGATAVTYSIASVQFSNAGSFDVVVTNSGGSTLSTSVNLVVTSPGLLTPDKVVLPAIERSYSLAINTSGSWTLSKSAAWITPSSTSGTGQTAISINVAPNPTAQTRLGTITVNGVAHSITQLPPSGLENLQWRNPVPSAYTLEKVIWNGEKFLAVGERGSIQTSLDGVTWTALSNQTSDFSGVAWGAGKFVAVGGLGRIRTSSDGGATWSTRTSGVGTLLNEVTWSGAQFVAVGVGGVILTSPDGITWTARTSGQTVGLRYVAWAAGQFVVVGDSGRILTSPDGITWTSRTSPTTQSLLTATSNGSTWVVAGGLGAVCTSPDGIMWTARTLGASNFVYDMVWDGAAFVASATGGRIFTSPDGITWTTHETPAGPTIELRSLAWNGQRYAAVGMHGVKVGSASRSSWPFLGQITASNLVDVIWSGREFIAVGVSGTIVSSVDGNSWIKRESGTTQSISSIAWNGRQFVAVGVNNTVLTSPDGVTWTVRTVIILGHFTQVRWTGTQFIAVGNSNKVAVSPDGLSWTVQGTGIDKPLSDICWNGQLYIATASNGTIFKSTDAVTWTSQVLPTTNQLYGIAWGNSGFAVVPGSGGIITSPDGVTWTNIPLDTGFELRTIIWTGSKFIALGEIGSIAYSTDGINWIKALLTPLMDFYSLTLAGDRFVVVGLNGNILTAIDPTASSAPTIELQPQSQSAVARGSASFQVIASGTPAPSYQWFKESQALSGATSSALLLSNLSATNAGNYSVVVTNTAGTVTSQFASLAIIGGFDAWSLAYFDATELADLTKSGPLADPDSDGLTNLVEYALDLDPKLATTGAGLPEVSTTASDWTYTYTRPSDRADLTYAVEASTTLTAWSTTGVTLELVSTASGTETWRARVPLAGAANLFFRLKITRN